MPKVIQFPKKKVAPEELVVLSEWKIVMRADGSYYACYTGPPLPDGLAGATLLLRATEAIAGLATTVEELSLDR